MSIVIASIAIAIGGFAYLELDGHDARSEDGGIRLSASQSETILSEHAEHPTHIPAKLQVEESRDADSSAVRTAKSALKSSDARFVRIQYARAAHCRQITDDFDRLMLAKSGVFGGGGSGSAQVNIQRSGAASKILEDCKEFIALGKDRLGALLTELGAHGKKISPTLFDESSIENPKTRAFEEFILSRDSALVERGIDAYIRILPAFGVDESTGGMASKEVEEDQKLWAASLLVAGCQFGKYCAPDSLQSQNLCLYGSICNINMNSFYTRGLDEHQLSVINDRSAALVRWFETARDGDIHQITTYSGLAKATRSH